MITYYKYDVCVKINKNRRGALWEEAVVSTQVASHTSCLSAQFPWTENYTISASGLEDCREIFLILTWIIDNSIKTSTTLVSVRCKLH